MLCLTSIMQISHETSRMDFLWFRDLGHLDRTGHFSRAAEMSHLSQPAFSRRIKALETWAGVALVDRSRHPVALTSAGAQLLEAGEQALERIETERREILEARAEPENYVVTFGAQHSIGWRFYPNWLQDLENAFGPIMSRLRADDLSSCVADLLDRQVDFVIAYASSYSPGVHALKETEWVRIGQDKLTPVCKAGADGEPLFDLPADAPFKVPYLRFGPNAPISEHIAPHLTRHGLDDRLGVVYENSMVGALRIRARDGAGVAWLPRSLIATDIAAGDLAVVGPPEWQVDLDIRLFRTPAHVNRLTRSIWTFLQFRG